MFNFLSLAKPGVVDLKPYQPGKPIAELQRELGIGRVVKLASNENNFGPSPKVIAAIQQALKDIKLYPDGSGYSLKQALTKHLSITSDQITLGDGSDNVIALIAQAFAGPNDEVIISQYAWEVFSIVTKTVGAKVKQIPAKDWACDLPAFIHAINSHTKIIFLANPNNPTGTYFSHTQFLEFMQQVPERVIVVLDEAYLEFVSATDYPNNLELLRQFPNLILTRTFSKAYGLAGIRVGYGISHPIIADLLNRIRLPFNVNSLGMVAAIAALQDQAYVKRITALIRDTRIQLQTTIQTMGFITIPSQANFICVDMKKPAEPIYQALLQEGIIVRPLVAYAMPNFLRISIGTPDEIRLFIKVLRKIISK